MKLNEIKAPVTSINGVGPSLAKILSHLNIFTVGDLLSYYPKKYEDRRKKVYIKDFAFNHHIHTVARVTGHQWFGYGKMRNLKLIINDGSGVAELIAFNRSFLEKTLPVDSIVSVSGSFFFK